MANDSTNTLNIDTLVFTDNYELIDTVTNTPFPSLPYQNDIQEDMLQRLSRESAVNFFMKLITKYPSVMLLGAGINLGQGEASIQKVLETEYYKLSEKISNSLDELSRRRTGEQKPTIDRGMATADVVTTGDPTVLQNTLLSDIKKPALTGKQNNVLQNEQLLLTFRQYIDFQKNNDYPNPNEITVTDDYGLVIFSIVKTSADNATIITTREPAITEELDTFDEFIDDIIENLTEDEDGVFVFKKLSRVTDYSAPILDYKTMGLFKCTGDERLITFYTGSLTDKNKKYYLSILNKEENTANSYHVFDISFAHISGSGSQHIENEQDIVPSKTMFRKYLVDCFGTNQGKFPFKNDKNGDYFYAIQLDRNMFKDKLDPGNFELCISPLSSSSNQLVNTGSGFSINQSSSHFYRLIDDSKDTKQYYTYKESLKDYYYITSGSLQEGVYNEQNDDAWGIVFPKMGLIILDGVVLDQSCSFNTVTASIDGDNIRKLFVSISGSATQTISRTDTGSFFARSSEDYLTETYFCRAYWNEFNYSSNYTYMTGSKGDIKNLMFRDHPNSYITSIGLYNKNKDLVAVAKLRQPLLKNEGTEYIFQVRVRLN